MFEPTTFPTTISDDPSKTAMIEEMSSGKDVPTATIVTPMMKAGNPKNKPIFSAEFVKNSEALTNTYKLAIKTETQITSSDIMLPLC